MRLIDAYALIETVEDHVTTVSCCPTVDWSMGKTQMKKQVIEDIRNAPTVNGWISVKDKLPVENHSIFWPWYGKKEWSKSMWREQSDKVLVTVAFKDGSRIVTTGETHDGIWNTTISRTLEPVVTHWQAMPEPPKGDDA